MVRQWSIVAVLAALALGAGGAAMAQSEPKSKPAQPAPLAMVEAVQMPAWVERGGASHPLVPGMELKDNDQVKTGSGARLLLRTADGSAVKLGEKGSLFLGGMQMRENKVFAATMKVAEGAFRFTSELFARFGGQREVSISIKTVTAGIRGTDLWGKSAPDREVVCLIEGKIEITRPGDTPFTMDQRLSYYILEGGLSQPVATVMPDQLREWAAETETQEGKGVSTRSGKWKITAAPALTTQRAFDLYRDLRRAGYPAEIVPSKVDDKRVYNVRLSNFETKQDAEFVASSLKRQTGFGAYDYKAGT
jgi:FecR-like protein/sporulation related protein